MTAFPGVLWLSVARYGGVDWLVTATAFLGIFLLGEKRRSGFAIGMLSCVFGVIFSLQIGSIANGVSSAVLFFLYLRGYVRWMPATDATVR